MKIGNCTFEEFVEKAGAFHGHAGPGILVGGFMVETARSRLPQDASISAICETGNCLPDSIQLLTQCTVGNGKLRVLDFGRYALTLFDKNRGEGWRVFLDAKKVEEWPEIKRWFFKLVPKHEQDEAALLAQIKEAGGQIYGIEPVQVQPHLLKRESKGAIAICPSCKEAYPVRDGANCRACQGNSIYYNK